MIPTYVSVLCRGTALEIQNIIVRPLLSAPSFAEPLLPNLLVVALQVLLQGPQLVA